MRSVVVVLPASICAMIPILRVFWSENCLAMSLLRIPGWEQKKGPVSGPLRVRIGCPAESYVVAVSKGVRESSMPALGGVRD
jgi:hypothetical protein